jgi:hypothetical protein
MNDVKPRAGPATRPAADADSAAFTVALNVAAISKWIGNNDGQQLEVLKDINPAAPARSIYAIGVCCSDSRACQMTA